MFKIKNYHRFMAHIIGAGVFLVLALFFGFGLDFLIYTLFFGLLGQVFINGFVFIFVLYCAWFAMSLFIHKVSTLIFENTGLGAWCARKTKEANNER